MTGTEATSSSVAATYQLSLDAATFYESTFVPALFAEWAQRLVDACDLEPGLSVLDVACGTGIVARTAAARVPDHGQVAGVDLNPAMLSIARACAPGLTWLEGDAAALPVPDGAFDRVLCQAAMMFFPDPIAALREMKRTTAPGGRVVVHVPGRLSHSPGYLALADLVDRHAGPDAARLVASYFKVGDPEPLAGMLTSAGLQVDQFDSWIGATRLPSLEAFLDVELLPLADSVDADTRETLRTAAPSALAPFIDESGHIAAPIEAHIVTAH